MVLPRVEELALLHNWETWSRQASVPPPVPRWGRDSLTVRELASVLVRDIDLRHLPERLETTAR